MVFFIVAMLVGLFIWLYSLVRIKRGTGMHSVNEFYASRSNGDIISPKDFYAITTIAGELIVSLAFCGIASVVFASFDPRESLTLTNGIVGALCMFSITAVCIGNIAFYVKRNNESVVPLIILGVYALLIIPTSLYISKCSNCESNNAVVEQYRIEEVENEDIPFEEISE